MYMYCEVITAFLGVQIEDVARGAEYEGHGIFWEKILNFLRVELTERNRENFRLREAKLWLHLRDLVCMTNIKMRERIFRVGFSHTRPSELSIMQLQKEVVDSTAFVKGCSMSGKDVMCRSLVKLEVKFIVNRLLRIIGLNFR